MAKPLVVLGSGGHAKVVVDAFRSQGREVLGIIDPNRGQGEVSLFGLPVLGDDDAVFGFPADSIELVNGIGALPGATLRRDLHRQFAQAGYTFAGLVHPKAWVSADAELAPDAQIMAGAIIQAGCRIGEDVIVNSGASVDHDCVLGAHCHIAPGAVICGGVALGRGVHVGSGAVVIQGISIGAETVVGAAAVVTKNLGEGVIVYPARSFITTRKGNRHES